MKRGKKYQDAAKLIERLKQYDLVEALTLVKKTSYVKFDASVDVAYRLNLDPTKQEQNLRGAIVLPHGTGKTQKICVIAIGEKAREAKEAGADYVGDSELLQKISGGWFDFDIMVATPDMMAQLGKLGKILGPKGLMPNPKTGTVTQDVAKAVNEIKKGKIEYRVDKVGNINCPIGKVSFTVEQLSENFLSLYNQLVKIKPQTIKGTYIKNITVSSSMGPGAKVLESSLKQFSAN
jgi:large subunit ribosomal protein L1